MAEKVDESKPSEETAKKAASVYPEPRISGDDKHSPKAHNIFKRVWAGFKREKKLTFPLAVVVVVGILLLVPPVHYKVLGLFKKQTVNVVVNDSTTNLPVSGADVQIAGKKAQTDGSGKATLNGVSIGQQTIKVSKKYYKDKSQTITVTFRALKSPVTISLVATGRQVAVQVTNKISGSGIANVQIKILDTITKTDAKGQATVVLPADKDKETADISLDGYVPITVAVSVSGQSLTLSKDNSFQLMPAGKIYFLSKLSGKIDLVKTNLDGTGRATVLAGTGNEDDQDTILLASRDWKYLLLKSRRDGDKAKLYLIETATDKLTTVDEGNAEFTLSGWNDQYFVYTVTRLSLQSWQPKQTALKSYNAATKQLITIDESAAEGTGQLDYATERIANVYTVGGNLLYTKNWDANYYSMSRLNDKQAKIMSVHPDGSSKAVVKASGIPAGTSTSIIDFQVVPENPKAIYFKFDVAPVTRFYEYEEGSLRDASLTDETFYKTYPTFLLSPSGTETFWGEARDGKNTLFVGDKDGGNGKQVASLSEYSVYGWYTDDYLLVSKSGSELYILPSAGVANGGQILKVTDYHKPAVNFLGYGGGYGGAN